MLIIGLAASSVMASVPLPDGALSDIRGGVQLPGGLDVVIAVQTDTRLDGVLLLRTIYRIDGAEPKLIILAPQSVQTALPQSVELRKPTVAVSFDSPNGTRISGPMGVQPAGAMASVSEGDGIALLRPIELTAGGPAADLSNGTVRLSSWADRESVRLSQVGLDVTHLVNGALGSIIVNSGNDRIIDTSTTISLDISGATAANLGSALLRIDTLVSAAAAALVPR